MSEANSKQLLWGWNPKLDIPAALFRMDPSELGDAYAFIAVIDSTPKTSHLISLTSLLHELGTSHSLLGTSVVVEGPTLVSLVKDHEFLNGFDEIWLFNELPRTEKPDAVPLTSDIKLRQGPPESLSTWMRENDGIAGLGDGDGLNWMTYRPFLAQLWAA